MKRKIALYMAFILAAMPELYGCQSVFSKNETEFFSETLNTSSVLQDETVSQTEYENSEDENITFFYQKDSKWENDNLGDSKYKMNDSGCLTCCVASVLAMSRYLADDLPENYNAGDVNRYFSENNIYDSEGNMLWEKLENLTGFTVEKTEEGDISDDLLDNYLNNGYYPIIRVRVNGNGNYHYVLITDKRDGEYRCMDPLCNENKTVPLSQFKNKIYAVRCLVK